jgi:hypothetical protein
MKWQDWLAKWKLTSLTINTHFLKMDWKPDENDRHAAWDLYIELLTRISSQPLAAEDGDEASALKSLYDVFKLTRDIMRSHRGCYEFTKIAVVVLNQVIRPFTARWHRRSLENAFDDAAMCAEFRQELRLLQEDIQKYISMLGEMAGVEEDLTLLEEV